MTTLSLPRRRTRTTVTVTPDRADDGAAANNKVLSLLGGICFALHPMLFLAGAVTSPPQESNSAADYITSLGRDPWLSGLSANLFHYSWVLAVFAALTAIGLVRGRKGRVLTLVSGLGAAVGSLQMSGLLYSDWVNEALANNVSLTDAVAVFEHVMAAPSIGVWLMSAKVLAILGFPLLFAGLARAGVISWFLVPVTLLPLVAFGLTGGGAIGIIAATICNAPYFVVAWRLVQRSQLA